MLYSILGILQWDSCVLWGGRIDFYFVEKCSVSLVAGRETDISGEYFPTLFVSLVPPYGAGETAFALPSLDGQLSTGKTFTLSR